MLGWRREILEVGVIFEEDRFEVYGVKSKVLYRKFGYDVE